MTATGVPPIVDQTALAASVARAVVAAQTASRTEPLDSRAFSKLDKFRLERTRWHEWAAMLQGYISNANADMCTEMLQVEGKTAVTPNVAVIMSDSSGEEQVSALHAHDAGGRTCLPTSS